METSQIYRCDGRCVSIQAGTEAVIKIYFRAVRVGLYNFSCWRSIAVQITPVSLQLLKLNVVYSIRRVIIQWPQ